MKSLKIFFLVLTSNERRSAVRLLPLILLRGVAEMTSVGLIFPFLAILGDPNLIETNSYLSWFYGAGGFDSVEGVVLAMGAVFLSVLLLATALKIGTIYVVNRWLELRKHTLATRLLEIYLRQPYEVASRRHSGDLLSTMLAESARIVGDVLRSITDIAQSLVSIALMLGLLFFVDPVITLLAIGVFGALYGGLLMSVRHRTTRLSWVLFHENKARYRIATEALRGGKLARLFSRELAMIESFTPHSLSFAQTNATASILKQVPRFVIEFFAISGVVILALVMMARNGIGSEGMASILPLIGVFALAIYRMMPAFQKGYTAIISVRLSQDAAEAILTDLSASNVLPQLPLSDVAPLPFDRFLEFRDVSYIYPGASETSLRNISLRIEANSTVGIVGQTGAGKSTLMDMILGLIEPTEGEIVIDGKPLRTDQIRAWRANIGYVPQETFLSDTSISRNIAFGLPDASIDMDGVRDAARMAQIDDYIGTLPEGYDTMVGEAGIRLSGGQRQRIGIARALYAQPRVIAFDEATSSLDTATEADVMEAISSLIGQRTILMVTHRLSTVRVCDRVITLEAGRIGAMGSYEEIALPRQKVAEAR